MKIEDFITNFKGQLEDTNTVVVADLDYVNADFWDSLTSMVIKVMIEDEYAVVLEVEQINEYSSINALFEAVKDKANA